MSGNKTLIIWLNNGTTCKFNQVEDFAENDSVIAFRYFGEATQVKRKAEFHKKNIAGWALEIIE